MFHVIELNSLDELETYRLLWHNLECKTRDRNLFHSLAWMQGICEHSRGETTPAVYIAMVDKYPIGIMPLVRQQVPTRLGQMNGLTTSVAGWGDHFSPVGPNPAATIHAVVKHLNQRKKPWDVIDLKDIDFHSYDKGRTRTAFRNAGWSLLERSWKTIATIDLQSGWANYWANKRSTIRENITQRLQAIESLPWKFHRYRSTDSETSNQDFENGLKALRTLLVNSPLEKNSSIYAQDRGEFFETMWREADRRGEADLCWVTLDGQPMAGSIGLLANHFLAVPKLLASASVSHQLQQSWKTLLIKQMLKNPYHRADACYRFADPNENLIREWQTGVLETRRYTRFARYSVRGQVLNSWHRCSLMLRQGMQLTRPRPVLPSLPQPVQALSNNTTAPKLRLVGAETET